MSQNMAQKEGADYVPLKSVISLVVTGFAAIISFFGLHGAELTTVLRNQEFLVEIMGLFVLLAVASAVLSVFVPTMHSRWARVSHSQAIALFLALIAGFAAIEPITPINLVSTNLTKTIHVAVASVVALCALLLFGWDQVRRYHRRRAPSSDQEADVTRSGVARRGLLRQWMDKLETGQELYVSLLLVSLFLTSLGVYTGLRIEARSQVSTGAPLQASLQMRGQDGILTLQVSSSHLPTQDYVLVSVAALPASYRTERICKGLQQAGDPLSCAEDPCSYLEADCDSLADWTVPPDASGDVDRQLTMPFSSLTYRRLQIETSICERASGHLPCNYRLAPETHFDLAVPSN